MKKKNDIDDMEVKLSREDIQNGWTEEKLRDYLKERRSQQVAYIKANEGKREAKSENVSGYNPHSWMS